MALTRISPGVYRDENGKTVYSKGGKNTTTKVPHKPLTKVTKEKTYTPDVSTPEGAIGTAQTVNYIGENGPLGSSSYEIDPATGKVTRNYTLAGGEDQLLNERRGVDRQLYGGAGLIGNQVANFLGKQLDYNDAPASPESAALGSEARKKYEDAVYSRTASRLDPRYSREEEDLKQNLADRGIQSNTERYKEEIRNFTQNKNDAYSDANVSAMREAGVESDRGFDQGMRGRQQFVDEKNYLRDQPIREMTGLLGAAHGPEMPNFTPTYNVDVGGLSNPYAERSFLGRENERERQSRMDIAKLGYGGRGGGGGGGGGGSAPRDPIADYEARKRIDLEYARQAAEYDKSNRVKRNPWVDAAGGLLGGVGQGLGMAAGRGLF